MARKEHNIHYIYKTTCNVTGKWYVGMHSTSNENDGYMGSGLRLRRSIRKYGAENHIKEIIEYLPTREELSLREQEIITKELISEDLCMNLVIGGQGGFISLDGVKKGAKTTNEKYKDQQKNWGSKGGINRIKKHGVCQNWIDKSYDWNGKKHSDETKQLMSENKKGTGTGDTNSQYGSFWITNGINNKKLKKDSEIPDGWYKGRI
jgi:hypothetical protein